MANFLLSSSLYTCLELIPVISHLFSWRFCIKFKASRCKVIQCHHINLEVCRNIKPQWQNLRVYIHVADYNMLLSLQLLVLEIKLRSLWLPVAYCSNSINYWWRYIYYEYYQYVFGPRSCTFHVVMTGYTRSQLLNQTITLFVHLHSASLNRNS